MRTLWPSFPARSGLGSNRGSARKVEVGAVVKRGQLLMQLDPQDLQLAQMQAGAALKAAESNRDLAFAELSRYQDLREKNFVSQAVLDGKHTAARAAQASYDQALAAYRNQANQAGYTSLVADVDGVVMGVDAEVGQVVAAGTPVVRLAQGSDKDVVIAIPEDRVAALRRAGDPKVRIWALPGVEFKGQVREIAPVADPATRTYTAKIALADAPPEVRLGMSAYVSFATRSEQAALRLPLGALHREQGNTLVWVVENGSVRQAAVEVVGTAGNDVLVAGDLASGQHVVTAGVNRLQAGQKVKLLGADPAADLRTAQAGSAVGNAK
jgi:membrane fusion protein, multidrug efflux system